MPAVTALRNLAFYHTETHMILTINTDYFADLH